MQKAFVFTGLLISAQILSARDLAHHHKTVDPDAQSKAFAKEQAELNTVLTKRTVEFLNQNRSLEKIKTNVLPIFHTQDRKFIEAYLADYKVTSLPESRLNGKVIEAFIENKKVSTFEVIDIEKEIYKLNGYQAQLVDHRTAESIFKYFDKILKTNPLQARNSFFWIQSAYANVPFEEKSFLHLMWFAYHSRVKTEYEKVLRKTLEMEPGGSAAALVLGMFDEVKKADTSTLKRVTGLKIDCKEKQASYVFENNSDGAREIINFNFSEIMDRGFLTAVTDCCQQDVNDSKLKGHQIINSCSKRVNDLGGFEPMREKSAVVKGKKDDATR